MKMSLNFKFLYNYFTSLFFEFFGKEFQLCNANNIVLNFLIFLIFFRQDIAEGSPFRLRDARVAGSIPTQDEI
jgi:hypothetical protein